MRIHCPLCGPRDLREFTYRGAALPRPPANAPPEDWDAYLHLRDNPAGPTKELWQHSAGCLAWIVVHRDTASHEILGSELAASSPAVRP